MKYEISIDNINYIDISKICNTKTLSVEHNLCSTEFKSALDKASIDLVPPANISLWSSVLNILIRNNTIYFKIKENNGTLVFIGVIDKSTLEIESKRIPSNCTITANDFSSLYLDKKPTEWIHLRKKKVSEIVYTLLSKAGMLYIEGGIDTADDDILEAFIINPENAEDYRTIIDTLLFETSGYVLDTTLEGKAKISKITWKDSASGQKRIIFPQSLSEVGVKTTVDILDVDGLKITYPTLAETENNKQALYIGITNYTQDSNNGLVGDIIDANSYYPKDADIDTTYQEYNEELLDRVYQTRVSRSKKDLAIVDVTEANLTVVAYDYDEETETVNYSTALNNDETFDFPVLSSLGMQANPMYYPTKAWILLKNKTDKKVSLNHFDITGKVLYKNKENTILIPNTAENPEEYDTDYIYTKERAERFAQFYWHFKRTSRYVSTWSENGKGTLGEVVIVNHKNTNFGQSSLIVSKTLTYVREDFPQTAYISVGIENWNQYPVNIWTNTGTMKSNPAKSTTSYFLANSVNQKPNIVDPRWSLTVPETNDSNKKYLWRKDITTYMNGSTIEEISLMAVHGSKGSDGNFWNIVIDCSQNIFKTSSDVATAVCRVYLNGEEQDKEGSLYTYTWKKIKLNGEIDSTFFPESPTTQQKAELGITGDKQKAIIMRSSAIGDSVNIVCEVSK